MASIRLSGERGYADHGWLKSHHTFSFADYYDPKFMAWGPIRVINEDFIAPGAGFGKHPHRNMEILTYVIDGALEHADSMGNTEVLRAREVQRMTAGSGVTHSEYNHSKVDPLHLIQIWILPEKDGLTPGYEQITFDARAPLTLLASPDGRDGSARINQRVELYRGELNDGESVELDFPKGGYLQLYRGQAELTGFQGASKLGTGDGAAFESEKGQITGGDGFLMFRFV